MTMPKAPHEGWNKKSGGKLGHPLTKECREGKGPREKRCGTVHFVGHGLLGRQLEDAV